PAAWSAGILLRELSIIYEAYQRNEPSPLPEPSIQYADFAVWQRERLTGATLERELGYWKQQIERAPALLDLSGDARRRAGEFAGAREPVTLSEELSEAIRGLSREEGVTLFMMLWASFNLLLQRYSGADDILAGTPVAGRTRPETQESIGFFVNTLVLRTRLASNETFRELLAQVRQTAIDAYAHQELPFEKLVAELQPERTLSYSPLFQVMFALNNTAQNEFRLPGLRVTPLETETNTAKFDLTLNLVELEGRLTGSFNY